MSEHNKDAEFLTKILDTIVRYAVENDMEPDETIKLIVEDMLQLLEIATFNNYAGGVISNGGFM